MAAHKFSPKVIVITGASSGIGQALAEHYARDGVTLALTGRDAERLGNAITRCEARGAHVVSAVLDVTNRDEMAQWLEEVDDQYTVDMVIANAGISAGTEGILEGEPPAQVRKVFDVNLNGVLNTIEPLQGRMIERGYGHIVLMSSLAGYRGWPGAPAYCASKAAVKTYGESLRGALRKSGVCVSVICPGFVKSRMSAVNEFPMPFLVDTPVAAKIIAKGLAKNKGRISFPFIPALMVWFISLLPDCAAQFILSKTPAKSSSQ